jgi:hypothetical protein
VAHEETSLDALSILDRVQPDPQGISFRVVQITQPSLVATNRTDEPLVIFGPQGEPFLRIADGKVEANLRSEISYAMGDPTGGHATAQRDLDPERSPRWRLIGRRRSWSWFDPRIRFRDAETRQWTIDARLGPRAIRLTGTFEPLEGHGHFRTVLVEPIQVPDLEVRLLEGLVPAVYVHNETEREMSIIGRAGEPFLRIGPKGVFGNTRSPDYWLGGTQTVRAVPAGADPSKPPRWQRLSDIPLWSWLEFRARLPVAAQQRSKLGSVRRTVLSWTTPMRLGQEAIRVRGRVDWIPPRAEQQTATETFDVGPWLAAGGAVLIAGAALLMRRRLRSGA